MQNAAIAACSIALLAPLAAHAIDLDYPSIGVKVSALPDNVKSLGVHEYLKEYQALISFGAGTEVRIILFDQPVSQGSIADASYRDALFRQAGIQPVSDKLHMLGAIAGQPAWVTGFAERLGPGAMMAYQCNYYLVVSQHLYVIGISGLSTSKAGSSSFDSAAKAIATGIAFEPLQQQPEKPLAPGELPPFLMRNGGLYYSDRARRLGEQGVVTLQFNIAGDGSARDIRVAGSPDDDLAQGAESLLQNGGFKVPPGWQPSASSKFTMAFHFVLSCPAADRPPEDAGPQAITICGSALAR